MELTAIVVLLVLIQYMVFVGQVGSGRPKYGVKAPATTGDETWERLFRVQQNTLEQLIIFIPAVVIFGAYIGGYWVLIPGLVFLVGRQLYAREYVSNPETRVLGMSLTFLAHIICILGALVAIAMRIF